MGETKEGGEKMSMSGKRQSNLESELLSGEPKLKKKAVGREQMPSQVRAKRQEREGGGSHIQNIYDP